MTRNLRTKLARTGALDNVTPSGFEASRFGLSAACTILLALIGCQADLKLPSTLVLACSQSSDCPTGDVCDVLGVCVPASKDEPAPALTMAPTVTPAIGTVGTKFQILLSVTEALAGSGLPTVTLELATPIPVTCTMPVSTDLTHFSCTYTATGMENGGFGGTIPFNVSLLNTINIPTTVVSAGTITIDPVLPQATSGITIVPVTALPGGASTPPTVAGLGSTISVWLTASKPLASPPMLMMANAPLSGVANPVAMTQLGASLTYNFSHVVVPEDPPMTTFSTTLIDDLGNTAPVSIGTVNIDPVQLALSGLVITNGSGPTVGSPPRFSAVAGYNLVEVTFMTSKVLPTPPTATITAGVAVPYMGDAGTGDAGVATGSLPMTLVSGPADAGGTYVFKYAVTGLETTPGGTPISSITEETEQVVINAVDELGNLATIGAPLVFDLQPPQILQDTVLIDYLPAYPVNSLTPTASAAGPNSTIVVSFSTNEPLLTTSLSALMDVPDNSGGGNYMPPVMLSWTPLSAENGTTFFSQAPVPGSTDISHNYFVVIPVVEDLVGNRTGPTTLASPEISVANTLIPVTPLDPTVMTEIRAPWGNATSFGIPYSALTGAASPTNEGKTIAVFDGPGAGGAISDANPVTEGLLAIVTPGSDGSFGVYAPGGSSTSEATGVYPYNLPPADYPVLYVAAVNAAGVPGLRREVMNVSWYANLWSTAGNGNASTLVKVPSFGPTLIPNPQDAFPASAAQMAQLTPTGGTPSTIAAGGVWAQRAVSSASPGARSGAAYAFDTRRGVGVLFGGTNGGANFGDTWEWDGSIWTQRSVQGPSPRTGAAMAFDPLHGVAVLFGGSNGSLLGDTWQWDGSTWKNVTPAIGSPGARWNSAMTWDSALNAVVLFGGDGGGAQPDHDLMMWNGATLTWAAVSGCSNNLTQVARSLHTLTYLPTPQNLLVVAGGNSGASVLGDVWTCTPGGSWTNPSNSNNLPPREGAVAAVISGSVFISGGDNGNTALNDVWKWTGTGAWTQAPSPPAPMSVRTRAAGGWDSVRGELDIVGGTEGSGQYCTAGGYCADNWGFNPTASAPAPFWADETPLPLPPALTGAAAAYDVAQGQTVIFGGLGADGNPTAQTWLWDGHHWLNPTPTTSPPARSGAAMAYYAPGGVVVLFGGDAATQSAGCPDPDNSGNGFYCNDTWTWDGTNWTAASSNQIPQARAGHVMSYDPGAGRTNVFMFGGSATGDTAPTDTWTWTPSGWLQLSPSSPPQGGRIQASAAYDVGSGDTLLFGGYVQGPPMTLENLTFPWTGTDWGGQLSAGTPGPGIRYGQVMAYDTGRNHVVLFGGQGASGVTSDVWDWNGVSNNPWVNRTPVVSAAGASPTARTGAVGVFDTTRNCFVVFGGTTNSGGVLGDVWELTNPSTTRPAEIASLNFAETGDLNNIASTGFQWTMTANVGGVGYVTTTSMPGASADVWNPSVGAWAALTGPTPTTTAGPSSPGQVMGSGNTQSAILGADGFLHFAFLPLISQGVADGLAVPPQISLSYVEVMVHYTKAK